MILLLIENQKFGTFPSQTELEQFLSTEMYLDGKYVYPVNNENGYPQVDYTKMYDANTIEVYEVTKKERK